MSLFGKKRGMTQPQGAGDYGNMQPGAMQSPFDGMQQQQAYNPMPEQSAKKPSLLPYILAAAEDTIARQMGYAPQGVARLNSLQDEQRALQQQGAMLAEQQRHEAMLQSQKLTADAGKPTALQRDAVWMADLRRNNPELADQIAQAMDIVDPTLLQTRAGTIFRPRVRSAPPTQPVGSLQPYTGGQ